MYFITKRSNNDLLEVLGIGYRWEQKFSFRDVFCIQTNDEYSNGQKASWGLLPGGYYKGKVYGGQHSIQTENIEQVKVNFRTRIYIKNRCLIPVDGFIEYQHIKETGKAMQKQLVTAKDGLPLIIAGIWNQFSCHLTFCVVTKPASGIMKEISNRGRNSMPMILSASNYEKWLEGKPIEDFLSDGVELKAEKVAWRYKP